jgi:hypothetical protein
MEKRGGKDEKLKLSDIVVETVHTKLNALNVVEQVIEGDTIVEDLNTVNNKIEFCLNVDLHDNTATINSINTSQTIVSANQVNQIIKFDSGASRCMSGIEGRLKEEVNIENKNIYICGYDGSMKMARKAGINEDNKVEYYVPGMPQELVLLSAHQYTEGDGMVVLMEDTGYVIQLTSEERRHIQEDILKHYTVTKRLKVVDRTYEVDSNDDTVSGGKKKLIKNGKNTGEKTKSTTENITGTILSPAAEMAHSAVASRFFNSSVHVTNGEERVMTLLLSGLNIQTLRLLYGHTKSKNPTEVVAYGLPRDITIDDINKYERLYGSTPEILQQALPNKNGTKGKGYFTQIEELTRVGERIEADIMASEFNEPESNGKSSSQKIPTLGGAIAAYLTIDCYSGYPHGYLLKNISNIVVTVKASITQIKTDVPTVQLGTFCSDVGILTQSEFRVMTPVVEKYLREEEKMLIAVAESYNHNNGLSVVESNIRVVKELIRFAILYILNNPNFHVLKITRRQIIMMWGELFHWALWIMRLRECPNSPGKTKYEVYFGRKPDLLRIRLLPIFSFVHIKRNIKKASDNPLNSNRSFWQRGLYVGPSYEVNGAIRVAVRDKRGNIRVIPTTDYKGVSDGGREVVVYNIRPELINPPHIEEMKLPHEDDTNEDEESDSDDENLLPGEVVDTVPDENVRNEISANESTENENSAIIRRDEIFNMASNEENHRTSISDDYNVPLQSASQEAVDESTPGDFTESSVVTPTRCKRASKPTQSKMTNRNQSQVEGVVHEDIYKRQYTHTSKGIKSRKESDKLSAPEQSNQLPHSGVTTRRKAAIMSHVANEILHDSKNGTKSVRKKNTDHILPIKTHKNTNDVQLTVCEPIPKIGLVPHENKLSKGMPAALMPVSMSLNTDLQSSTRAVTGANGNNFSNRSNTGKGTENDTTHGTKIHDITPTKQRILEEISTARVLAANHAIDWSEYNDDDYYYDPVEKYYYKIAKANVDESNRFVETGYKAVTVNVPKTVDSALSDPTWGDASRQEMSTLKEITGTLVKADPNIAREDIKNGSNCLMILMVFEEKMKDGKLVRKVRMVADGRRHTNVGETYSPTPSREEFLIYMHLCAVFNWNYYWLDENRAFLTADRQDKRKLYARFPGDKSYYEVNKALYGTRDGPRDYGIKVESVLKGELKFTRLQLCSCIYVEWEGDKLKTIVYDHVDDFVFSGQDDDHTMKRINEFRKFAKTDDPIKNAPLVLGMEISRNFLTHTIEIRMEKKILELYALHKLAVGPKLRKIPMQVLSYIVRDSDIEALPEAKKRFLDKKENKHYMGIVGSLIWIEGVRFDIIFCVLYLSWHTHAPRQHHLDVAYYLIGYLNFTHNMPLVLGGTELIQGHHFWDSSHATGPKSCGITGLVNKLGYNSGAVSAKATKQKLPNLSSFENELVGSTSAFKNANRVDNILTEIHIQRADIPTVYNDNQAVLDFIRGNSISKGSRHMELRQWYTRLEYQAGKVKADYLKGTITPADKLTKPSVQTEHFEFTTNIQGLNLLEYDYFKSILPHEE